MRVVSVNIATPLHLRHNGKEIETSIFKAPVHRPVTVQYTNIQGDGQADLKNHGGKDKAVYAYSADHYETWKQLLSLNDLNYGSFGENLTIEGLNEDTFCIGDQLQIGSTLLAITQPRVPCFKLGIRFNDTQMPQKFINQALTGCYLKVLEEGSLQNKDSVNFIKSPGNAPSVKSLFEAYFNPDKEDSVQVMLSALEADHLSDEWRNKLERYLNLKSTR